MTDGQRWKDHTKLETLQAFKGAGHHLSMLGLLSDCFCKRILSPLLVLLYIIIPPIQVTATINLQLTKLVQPGCLAVDPV